MDYATKREIAESFFAYLSENDLLKQLHWRRCDLAIHFEDFRSRRRSECLKTTSFSTVLFLLARTGKRVLQVWNGVTVVFRGARGFNTRRAVNTKQHLRDWKLQSSYVKITSVSENTKSTQLGHFLRKLTTMSREFAVIELEMTNTSSSVVCIEGYRLLSRKGGFRIESDENTSFGPSSKYYLTVQSVEQVEVCSTEIEISLIVNDIREDILIYLKYEVRDENDITGSDSEEEYANQSRDSYISFSNFIEGVRPDMSCSNNLERIWPLPQCKVSQELKNAIKRGALNANKKLVESPPKCDILLRKSLEEKLDRNNYGKKFEYLLHIEEWKNEQDIKRYDMRRAVLTRRSRGSSLLYLKIPGLAEKRPSVLRGDRVYVKSLDANDQPEIDSYEGYVHHVEQEEVGLGFNAKILNSHIQNKKYYVRFAFNRLALKLMHRSTKSNLDRDEILFSNDEVVPVHIPPRPLMMRNRLIDGNCEQREAVETIVTGQTARVYIIYGPPGTGKTITMVEVIHQLIREKPNSHMLVCAPSNSACDLLTSRLLIHCDKRKILRMHAASRNWKDVPEDVKDVSNHQGEFRFPSKQELMKCQIIVTTLVTAGRIASAKFGNSFFDYVFIDEAGQAMEPETMIAVAGILSDNGKIVLAGDPKQLGPIIRSPIANRNGLELSYLERLMKTQKIYQKYLSGEYNQQCITKLLKNYRSHPSIIEVSNREFYDGELQVCADEMQRNYLCQWDALPKKDFPLLFHGVQGEDKQDSNSPSYFNMHEATQVKKYVDQLLDIKGKRLKPSEIGVITPYRKQVEKIKKLLIDNKEIKVGSVEEFQGQERRVIIISTVRSNVKHLEFDATYNLGFLRNPKHFNVAVTRAKALLVIIGNPRILCLDKCWGLMLQYCMNNGGYTGIPFDIGKFHVERALNKLDALSIPNDDDADNSEDQINPQWRQDP